jgi:hypothetical protein
MAQNDLDGTLAWLDRYSSDPGYDDALIEASMRGVAQNPRTVARLIDERPALREQLAPRVASAWASEDSAAAERWVLELPAGPVQDQSIRSLLQGGAINGEFNADLLARLGSDAARQQAVMTALPGLGRSNPALGRRLIDEHISDAAMRETAERQLESGSNMPAELLMLLNR